MLNKMKLITAPVAEPVTLGQVKKWLRVDHDEEDDLLLEIIAAARDRVERHTSRHLITQTWDLFLDRWPARDCITFPRAPLQSVVEIAYRPATGSEVIVSSSTYIVDTVAEPGYVTLAPDAAWPTADLYKVNPIRVRHTTGYGLSLPHGREAFLFALRWACSTFYDHRQEIIAGSGVSAVQMPQNFADVLEDYVWNKYAPVRNS